MHEIESLMGGFAVVLTWHNVLYMVIGIVLGVIIGVLPGLGGANGVAILLPLTFSMSPTSAIILLSCIYWGALVGGAITSILFNIPGEPWSVATTFDGHPMAQNGKAGIEVRHLMSHTSGVSVVFFGGFLPFRASIAIAVPTPPMAAGFVTAAPGAPSCNCDRNLLLSAPMTGTFSCPAFLSASTTT